MVAAYTGHLTNRHKLAPAYGASYFQRGPRIAKISRRHVITQANLSRRAALFSPALAWGVASAWSPADAAVSPFCGVTDGIPSWAFTAPWEEDAIDSNNGLKVWTRVIGKQPGGLLAFGQNKDDTRKRPLLVVHGGPGLSSKYMESLEVLCAVDRRVAFYDQAGCGKSRTVSKGQTPEISTLTLAMHVDELQKVRKAFNFKECHLLGHGWGGILALSYLLDGNTDGILSLTLASTPPTYRSWIADRQKNAQTLGVATCEALLQGDSSPAYKDALYEYRTQFISRHSALPGCLAFSEQECFKPALDALCGGSMFQVAGTLSDWDPSSKLTGLAGLPTLVTRGDHDEISQENAQRLADSIPGAQLTTFENSGSCTHIDAYETFLERLNDHMTAAELKV